MEKARFLVTKLIGFFLHFTAGLYNASTKDINRHVYSEKITYIHWTVGPVSQMSLKASQMWSRVWLHPEMVWNLYPEAPICDLEVGPESAPGGYPKSSSQKCPGSVPGLPYETEMFQNLYPDGDPHVCMVNLWCSRSDLYAVQRSYVQIILKAVQNPNIKDKLSLKPYKTNAGFIHQKPSRSS